MTQQYAFTLIEVLIVLIIISILSLLAVPGLWEILQRAQDNAVRSDLIRMIETARNEAVLRRKSVTLCKSRDSRHCGGDWSDGQMIFTDTRRDDTVHDPAQIIAVNKMKIGRGKLYARFYPLYRETVHFNLVVSEFNDNGSFWYCRTGAALPAWAVKINKSGSAHEMLPDINGEIKDAQGKLYSC